MTNANSPIKKAFIWGLAYTLRLVPNYHSWKQTGIVLEQQPIALCPDQQAERDTEPGVGWGAPSPTRPPPQSFPIQCGGLWKSSKCSEGLSRQSFQPREKYH